MFYGSYLSHCPIYIFFLRRKLSLCLPCFFLSFCPFFFLPPNVQSIKCSLLLTFFFFYLFVFRCVKTSFLIRVFRWLRVSVPSARVFLTLSVLSVTKMENPDEEKSLACHGVGLGLTWFPSGWPLSDRVGGILACLLAG